MNRKTAKVSSRKKATVKQTTKKRGVVVEAKVEQPAKPSTEELSRQAAKALDRLRRSLETEAQSRYDFAKWSLVKELATQAGVKLTMVDLTSDEEIRVKP